MAANMNSELEKQGTHEAYLYGGFPYYAGI
jgi:hypothetical protein